MFRGKHMHKKQRMKCAITSISWYTVASAVMLTIAVKPVGAQDTPSTPTSSTADNAAVPDVVVTGSRIERSGFNTPTPVTVMSQEEIQAKAVGTIVDLVQEIPQLAPDTVSAGSGNVGSAFLNLRGIGPQRTLLLVDGRRFAQTSPTGGTDINVLPSSLIKSIDVVTGGASAAYGSDAVAGVVEVTLDDKFEGFKGTFQGGASPHGDSRELLGSLGWGTSFAEGRGHWVVAGDAYYDSGMLQGDRAWGRQAYGIIPNPGYPNNGQARQLIVPGVRLSEITDGGVIIAKSGPLAGIQFGPGGSILPYNLGTYAGSTFMVGGDGADISRMATESAPNSREVGFTRVSFDISSQVTWWADALVSQQRAWYQVIPNYNNGDIVITQQNAFLPAAIKQIMVANNIQSFDMGRTNEELGWNFANGTNTTQRYGTGLDGRFGESWKWSAFLQYSTNEQYTTEAHNRNEQAWKNSIDSVISPATGQPICRSTLTNPNNGCVPVDLFGPGSVTPSVVDYVTGTSFWDETMTQAIVAGNLSGEPVKIWAGPLSIATGFEARRETTDGTSDPLSQLDGWRQVNAQPLNGEVSVEEVYLETVVPLLTKKTFADDLDFNGAVRETHYSVSGMANTWKAGLNYSPTDEVRFRATRSRDLRAPNIDELFTTRSQNNSPINDPTTNQVNQTLTINGGNPHLQPEIGNTVTAGVVYQPKWAGLSFSADYYHIKLDGAISTLDPQSIVNDCYLLHETSLCSEIVRSPTTNMITEVIAQEFNAQSIETQGVDLEAAYTVSADKFLPRAKGQFRLRAIATYVSDLTTTVNGVTLDTAGEPNGGGVPKWEGNVTAEYLTSKWTFMTEVRYVGGGVLNATYEQGIDINDNNISGRTYVTLSAQYAMSENGEIYARVSNLFDVDPPVIPLALQAQHAAGSPFYDVVGRDIAVGVRFHF